MAKKKDFNDPLKEVDPIMEQAFSETEDETYVDNGAGGNYNQQPTVAQVQFPPLRQGRSMGGEPIVNNIFSNIPVNVSVELGRAQVSLKEVYELSEGAIIELERLAGEPLDLVVNGQVIAQGEVVAIDNNYGLRLTNILSRPQP